MKHISSYIFSFYDFIDIFHFPLALTLNRTEKTSTYTGKIITLGILTFLSYSLISSNLLNKKNAEILIQELMHLSHHPTMFFSKKNLTMFFGITDNNNNFLIDETMYSLTFYINHLNNSNHYFNKTEFRLKACTQDDFIEDPSEFARLGLNGTHCLPNEVIKLGGYWDEEIFDYFSVQLKICQNSSSNNIMCKSTEEISDFMKNKYLKIYITNHNFDALNYETPLTRNLKMFYQILDSKLSKSMELYLQNHYILTDDGFFLESLNVVHSFKQGEVMTDMKLKSDDENWLFTFNVYSSDLQTNINRNYEKMQTLLARLGGICNFLFLFGFMISKFENHYNLISLISNELFIFPKVDRKSFLKNGNTLRNSCKRETSIFKNKISDKSTGKSKQCKKLIFSELKSKTDLLGISISNIQKKPTKDSEQIHSDRLAKLPSQNLSSNGRTKRSPHSNQKDLQVVISRKINKETLLPNTFSDATKIFINLQEAKEESKQIPELKLISETPLGIRFVQEPLQSPTFINEGNMSPTSKRTWQTKLKALLKGGNSKPDSPGLKDKEAQVIENLEHYQKLKNKENFFSVGFKGFLKLLFKDRFNLFKKMNNREKLFQTAKDQIADELDILKILKKLQDLEKLKRILLNDDQLYLFNLLSKPMIVLDKHRQSIGDFPDKRFKFSVNNNAILEKKKLNEIYNRMRGKDDASQVDEKIIKLLDEDVMCFLNNKKFIE